MGSLYAGRNAYTPSVVSAGPSGRSVLDYTEDLQRLVGATPGSVSVVREAAYDRAGEDKNLSNPPFNFGIAGRLTANITGESKTALKKVSEDPRILRGYIRRSVLDPSDPTSKFRLYFMYNPEVIERQFVSYLDQQALDPFNTLYGSNNLVAPPGILDFSFELFFDRQSEVAADAKHPGTKVDFDYFDRVCRGVEPTQTEGSELADAGVFLINPRNIKVVFSPDLTIEGRAYTANVRYEKFSHRMVPTRIRITLTMKVQYIGPDTTSFSLFNVDDIGIYTATVPYEESISAKVTYGETLTNLTLESDTTNNGSTTDPTTPPAGGTAAPTAAGVAGAAGSVPGNGNAGFIWPCKTGSVTQEFRAGGHPGMDIGIPIGTPLYAVQDGVVRGSQVHGDNYPASGGYGFITRIQHKPGLATGYAHKASNDLPNGTPVKQGQLIGYSNTVGWSTGPHLHFEVYEADLPEIGGAPSVNPRDYLPPGGPQ